jgi:hypothetical protein
MIEALKGCDNLAVTGRSSKDRMHRYYVVKGPWKEIHKVPVPGCNKAWRFSEPVRCRAPKIDYTKLSRPKHNDHLIPFYDALAMVQSECFMRLGTSRTGVTVTDDEMRLLETLHEHIRNVYEHFVPKGYAAPVAALMEPAILCLRLSRELLFYSRITRPPGRHKELVGSIDRVNDRLSVISKTEAAQPL